MKVLYPGVKDVTAVPCSVCGQDFGLPTRDMEAERAYIVEANAEAMRSARERARVEARPVKVPRPQVERRWYCSLACLNVASEGVASAEELDAKVQRRKLATAKGRAAKLAHATTPPQD